MSRKEVQRRGYSKKCQDQNSPRPAFSHLSTVGQNTVSQFPSLHRGWDSSFFK